MYYKHVLFVEEKAMASGTTYISRNVDCWKVPRLRRSTLAACTVMIAQQMCGINSQYTSGRVKLLFTRLNGSVVIHSH
jgi:hypothetical protein